MDTERYDHLKKLCDLVSTSESLRLAGQPGHSKLRCKANGPHQLMVLWSTPEEEGQGISRTEVTCPVFAGVSGGLISHSTDHVIFLKLSSAFILGQQVLDDVDRDAGGGMCVGVL